MEGQPTMGSLSSKAGISLGYDNSAHPHVDGVESYRYDQNGSMTWRWTGGTTYKVTYDGDNRLAEANGVQS
jgi:hypothetical protein